MGARPGAPPGRARPPLCGFPSLLSPGSAGMPSPGVRGRSQCEGGCAGHRAGLRGRRKSRACDAAVRRLGHFGGDSGVGSRAV